MKKLLSAAFLLAAFASAHAETFNFSYTFADGSALTGSLDGQLSGDLVQGVSNVHISFMGTDFTGSLSGAAWDATTSNWNSVAGAVISTNAAKNNFIFADADPQNNLGAVNNYFYFVNSTDPAMGNQAFAANFNTGDVAFDQPTSNATWSLTAAHGVPTAVPEPATTAMLLGGLGLVGAVARRRRQA